jgi:epidermal growth factor receptor substrate 15
VITTTERLCGATSGSASVSLSVSESESLSASVSLSASLSASASPSESSGVSPSSPRSHAPMESKSAPHVNVVMIRIRPYSVMGSWLCQRSH